MEFTRTMNTQQPSHTQARADQRKKAAAAKQLEAELAAWKQHYRQQQIRQKQYDAMKKCVWYTDFTQPETVAKIRGVPSHYEQRMAFKQLIQCLGQSKSQPIVVPKATKKVMGAPRHLEERMASRQRRTML